VLDARYQGSHWLIRVRLGDGTELEAAQHGEPPPHGQRVGLQILDGWVVPESTAVGEMAPQILA
jgi:hypothetical protein